MTKRFFWGLAGVVTMLPAQEVLACGGFFCNQQPVEQTGEQIVFAQDSGIVTAQIRINYAGKAKDFAWVVPLPAEPTAPTVGSDELFNQLSSRLRPSFWTEYHYDGQMCGDDWWFGGDAEAAGGEEAEAEAEGEGESVVVSFRGAVGPYDTAIINSDDPEALLTWLQTEGYDVSDDATKEIAWYVEQNYWFVALKLLKDNDVGDLQPIVLNFPFDRPCVPLKLTAIAAAPDLPVRLWVLGTERSIPTNYAHVLIDEAKIDWLSSGQNYTQVVTDAANEAGGRSFVTEYAGTSKPLANALYWKGRFNLEALAAISDPILYIQQLASQGFPRDQQLLGFLTRWIPPPSGMAPTDFYNEVFFCWCDGSSCECKTPEIETYLATLEFDPISATAELEKRIVAPLEAAQQLIDASSYVTQMFTTISPDEMTLDPMFAYNSELPDVSNQHKADLYSECILGHRMSRIELSDGRVIWLDGDEYGYAAPNAEAPLGTLPRLLSDLPGSERAETLFEGKAAPKELYSKAEEIDEVLARHNAAVFGIPFAGGDGEGCACSLANRARNGVPWAMLLCGLGLALLLSRRRIGS